MYDNDGDNSSTKTTENEVVDTDIEGKKIVNNETILFNIQYVQRYTLIEVLFANFLKYKGYKVKGLICAGHNYCEIYSSNNEKPNFESSLEIST